MREWRVRVPFESVGLSSEGHQKAEKHLSDPKTEFGSLPGASGWHEMQ